MAGSLFFRVLLAAALSAQGVGQDCDDETGECFAPNPLVEKDVEAWQAVVNWMRSQGAEVREGIVGRLITQGSTEGVRGLLTERAFDKDVPLFRVPRKLWMEASKFPAVSDAFQRAEACRSLGVPPNHFKLSMAIALEVKKGEDSFWGPWLKMLPSLEDFQERHPYLAGEELQKEFGELPLMKVVHAGWQFNIERTKECFEDWRSVEGSPGADLSWEEALHGYMMVVTRSFRGHDQATVIVPGTDMANTAANSDVNSMYSFTNDMEWFEVNGWQSTAADKEVFLGYCRECDNEYTMGYWGYFLEDNTNTLTDLEPLDCDAAGLRESALPLLDLGTVNLDIRAPRCSPDALDKSPAAQRPLRCALARLTFESCAASWGFEGRPGRTGKYYELIQDKLWHSHVLLGKAARRAGMRTEAEAEYMEALRISPKCTDAMLDLGTMQYDEGNMQQALVWYQKVVEAEPNEPSAHIKIAQTYKAMQDHQKAIEAYTEVLQVRDDGDSHAHANANIGILKAMAGDFDAGQKALQEAIELQPKQSSHYFNLAMLFLQKGDWDLAGKTVAEVLTFDPDNKEAKGRLQSLEQMKKKGKGKGKGNGDENDAAGDEEGESVEVVATFVNEHPSKKVYLFWRDMESGEDELMGEVAAGASQDVETFSGHTWVVRGSEDPSGKAVMTRKMKREATQVYTIKSKAATAK
eukprot:TRINITY_DN18268_c1_g1_i1.p1 TRINITY_DN18268_c1_g1~~TRINITY_DN18268_c1_g1_i1.p1  ORF type:complete len:720 (-),score=182.24 TRINITY_DN18268_c1_g1_i1:344-2422(-)